MKKSICRGCAHQKGWILLPKGEPPSGPALPVQMLRGGKRPSKDASQPSESSSGISTVPVERPKKPPMPLPPLLLKQEETKLLTLRQQTVDAGLPTGAIDAKLGELRATTAPVAKVPAQALMEATNQHRRCTQAREKAQAALAAAYKNLAEAQDALKQRHEEEEKALQQKEAARERVADMPAAPAIPLTILHNTARALHQELSVASTLPSVDQLILALGHIMEKQWSLHSATAAPGTPSILQEASKTEEGEGVRRAPVAPLPVPPTLPGSLPTQIDSTQDWEMLRIPPPGTIWETTTWTRRPHALVPRAGPTPHSLVPRVGSCSALLLSSSPLCLV